MASKTLSEGTPIWLRSYKRREAKVEIERNPMWKEITSFDLWSEMDHIVFLLCEGLWHSFDHFWLDFSVMHCGEDTCFDLDV